MSQRPGWIHSLLHGTSSILPKPLLRMLSFKCLILCSHLFPNPSFLGLKAQGEQVCRCFVYRSKSEGKGQSDREPRGLHVSFTQSTASAGHPAGLRVQTEPLTGSRRRPSISCPCLLMSFLPLLRIILAGLTIWPVWEVPGGHTFTNPVSSALALELLQLQMLLRIS